MHQKRLSAPKSYPIKRKLNKRFLVCPRPGPHPKNNCITLLSVLRDMLEYCENSREARYTIKLGKVMVDGKTRKDLKYPVGIFDIITLPEIKESYIVVSGEKYLKLLKTDKKSKICRIENKTKIKGGKTQLNLHDGKNLIVDKDRYKTKDSLVLELPNLKIEKHLKRKENSLCLIIKGSNMGKIGKIKDIKKTPGSKPNMASIEINQKTVDIPEKFVFVIGEKTPEIKISD